jgi:hypothetical protein
LIGGKFSQSNAPEKISIIGHRHSDASGGAVPAASGSARSRVRFLSARSTGCSATNAQWRHAPDRAWSAFRPLPAWFGQSLAFDRSAKTAAISRDLCYRGPLICHLPDITCEFVCASRQEREAEMRSFIAACVAAVAIAAVGAIILNSYQEAVDAAFATKSVRI